MALAANFSIRIKKSSLRSCFKEPLPGWAFLNRAEFAAL